MLSAASTSCLSRAEKDINIGNHLSHYASDIACALGIQNISEWGSAVARAINACRSSDIPVEKNFHALYRDTAEGLLPDWKMSDLATGLFIVNSNTDNPMVARAQTALLSQLLK